MSTHEYDYPDSPLDRGMRLISRWYHDEIRSLADCAIQAVTGYVAGCDEDHPAELGRWIEPECPADEDRREWLTTWVDRTLDGHEFVIYTHKAQAALLASDNSDAYTEESGESDARGSDEVRCYVAMRADLWELLEARADEWEADGEPEGPEEPEIPTIDELRELATITLRCERDDVPVRGNALASGDDAADKAQEDEILARLDRGDDWAWCAVTVTAEYDGHTGSDSLGACSYESEAAFRAADYYPDMVTMALEDLHRNLVAE